MIAIRRCEHSWCSLLVCNFVEGRQDSRINCTGVVQECSSYSLHVLNSFGVEWFGGVHGGKLNFLPVVWYCPGMRQMLRATRSNMAKLLKSLGDVFRH